MKICILIPSEEYRQQAGARIRYGRIKDYIFELGHELVLQEITQFPPGSSEYDIHIFSKCNDAQALIAAHVLNERGKKIGVDLFDDYFSQEADSRFVRFRSWLSTLIGMVDFVLCSTPAMASVAQHYRSDIPVHVMNDPASDSPSGSIGTLLEQKLAGAYDSQVLKVAWFGVGDNPHFHVGLSDLAAFGTALTRLRSSDWDVKLTILTNARAMTARNLAQLRRLSLPYTIEEWSEAREKAVLEESMLCFLPVNAQNFSIVKSLNRAISALTAGCQVLSSGYPLYDRLDPLIYREVTEFLANLAEKSLRLRQATIAQYSRAMASLASVHNEANGLIAFLKQFDAPSSASTSIIERNVAVIHGVSTNGAVHKMIKRVGGLSVGSPFCIGRLNFDVVFRQFNDGRELELYVAETALGRVREGIEKFRNFSTEILGQRFWTITKLGRSHSEIDSAFFSSPAIRCTIYSPTISRMQQMLIDTFGPLKFIRSELSNLPLVSDQAAK